MTQMMPQPNARPLRRPRQREEIARAKTTRGSGTAWREQPVVAVNTESKETQTSEPDDQWNWERVWKAAFGRIQQQVREKDSAIQALEAQVRELQALVEAQQRAMDEAASTGHQLKSKHQAEIEHLRSMHALELEELRAQHKQKVSRL